MTRTGLRAFIEERIAEREAKDDEVVKAALGHRAGGRFADHLPLLRRLRAETRVLRDVLEDYDAHRHGAPRMTGSERTVKED